MESVVDFVMEPLRYGFMVRALLVSVLIGIICPVIGCYVVIRSLAFMGDALAHAVLPGLVVGMLIGVSPFAAGIPMAILIAFLIGYISHRSGVSEDTAIGILFAALFAVGLVMLKLAGGVGVDLEDILLGQVLGVSTQDVLVTFGLTVVVLSVLYLFHKELVFTSFDPQGASVIGLPTGMFNYLLLVLLAIAIVVSLKAVGIVLVMAMLVTPAATSYLLVRGFPLMMAVGAAVGALAAVVGLYVSFYLNIPSGPAMTLAAVAMFVMAMIAKRKIAI